MITGIHAILYSSKADDVRVFLRDVLGLPSVDAGGGWPIFAAPPTELAVHPTDGASKHELYLMCDDVADACARLNEKGVATAPITERGWGLSTTITLPGGDELGLYQPKHPSPPRRSNT